MVTLPNAEPAPVSRSATGPSAGASYPAADGGYASPMAHDEPTDTTEAPEQELSGATQPAEVLVEEISIDGMCGVY